MVHPLPEFMGLNNEANSHYVIDAAYNEVNDDDHHQQS